MMLCDEVLTHVTGALLDSIGSYVNPLRLVRHIPDGMQIDNLRGR